MELLATDVAHILGDRAIAVRLGDAREVLGFAPALPGRPNHLSFILASSYPRSDVVAETASDFLIVDSEVDLSAVGHRSVFVVEDPRREFVRIMVLQHKPESRQGIHAAATVDPNAFIGSGTWIGPGAVIAENVTIGNNCFISANCVIESNTRMGDRVRIGPGVVIGQAGFGYVREPDGTPVLMPHLAGVTIGDDVEIGANTVVDRGAMTDTVIEDSAKIDNLVHIAHNVRVGRGAFVIASSVVCGSVEVGAQAWIAPNATIAEHRVVGQGSVVGLSALVLKDVHEFTTVAGIPASVRGASRDLQRNAE